MTRLALRGKGGGPTAQSSSPVAHGINRELRHFADRFLARHGPGEASVTGQSQHDDCRQDQEQARITRPIIGSVLFGASC